MAVFNLTKTVRNFTCFSQILNWAIQDSENQRSSFSVSSHQNVSTVSKSKANTEPEFPLSSKCAFILDKTNTYTNIIW